MDFPVSALACGKCSLGFVVIITKYGVPHALTILHPLHRVGRNGIFLLPMAQIPDAWWPHQVHQHAGFRFQNLGGTCKFVIVPREVHHRVVVAPFQDFFEVFSPVVNDEVSAAADDEGGGGAAARGRHGARFAVSARIRMRHAFRSVNNRLSSQKRAREDKGVDSIALPIWDKRS